MPIKQEKDIKKLKFIVIIHISKFLQCCLLFISVLILISTLGLEQALPPPFYRLGSWGFGMFTALFKIQRLPISCSSILQIECPLVNVRDFVLRSDLGEEVGAALRGHRPSVSHWEKRRVIGQETGVAGRAQGARGEALGPTLVSIHLEGESGRREKCCLPMGRQGLGRKGELGTPERVNLTLKAGFLVPFPFVFPGC